MRAEGKQIVLVTVGEVRTDTPVKLKERERGRERERETLLNSSAHPIPRPHSSILLYII